MLTHRPTIVALRAKRPGRQLNLSIILGNVFLDDYVDGTQGTGNVVVVVVVVPWKDHYRDYL
jgi:hypothetical protein